ncbi:MAG: SRPBCC family protein [Acidobacteriota bacterium]
MKTVWDAWTDSGQVAQWWGPRGFTITTHSKDLRPGGHWAYTMHGPDGTDYANKTIYHEVEPCARLVYDHGGNDDRPPLFRVTATFAEVKGQTRMELCLTLPTPEEAEQTRQFIKKAGGNSTWDRLAEYLAEESTGKRVFVINRSFDAPIERMYQMWTDPAHLSTWLAPTGFTIAYLRADIRPGGSTLWRMTNGHGITMYARAEYREITRPHRIVYVQNFCDESETLGRHPLAPTWPAYMLTQVTLTEEGPEHTRVTVEWEPYGDATPAEIATFVAGRAGMTAGWTGSFDKLEEVLAAG